MAANLSRATGDSEHCFVCGTVTRKKCGSCMMVSYCSKECQRINWNSGHNTICKPFKIYNLRERKVPSEKKVPRERKVPSEKKSPRERKVPSEKKSPRERKVPSEKKSPRERKVPSEKKAPRERKVPRVPTATGGSSEKVPLVPTATGGSSEKVPLVPTATGGSSKIFKESNKILFPYEEFVQFFNWEELGHPPCGLINSGNSCFANVVLQCLAYTRPLAAYLLKKGHKTNCQMENWCFLCEFQTHVERANSSDTPFSPANSLTQLHQTNRKPVMGEQQDAHEFMRFAIEAMQSVCLYEHGGEKAVHPRYKETTLVQHIFGGRIQSQITCSKCNNVSEKFENMMDLNVEIDGDVKSLEECLQNFNAKESLHGDNKYKCDRCDEYVVAWKCLAVECAPNILTIALKRFKIGTFGKLNKIITFPETLDFRAYMCHPNQEDRNDVYKLYAAVVHVDFQNAADCGHYICYVKDFGGNWYKISDTKVSPVDLNEVLSETVYMLLYSRVCARQSCLLSAEMLAQQESENVDIQTVPIERSEIDVKIEEDLLSIRRDVDSAEASLPTVKLDDFFVLPVDNWSEIDVKIKEDLSSIKNTEKLDDVLPVEVMQLEASDGAKCEGDGAALPDEERSVAFPPGFLVKHSRKEVGSASETEKKSTRKGSRTKSGPLPDSGEQPRKRTRSQTKLLR